MRSKFAGFWRKIRFTFNIISYIDFLGKTLLWWHSLPWAKIHTGKFIAIWQKYCMSPASYELSLHLGGVTMLLHVLLWEQESLEFHSSSKDASYVPALPFVGMAWLKGEGWQVCRQPYHLASSRAPATNILCEFQWAILIYDKLDAPKRWPPKKATSLHRTTFGSFGLAMDERRRNNIFYCVTCMARVPVLWKTIRKKVPYEI